MEVILLEKIKNLGNLGDTVNVKPGYGRNYLLPSGKAVSANKANVAQFAERRAELEKKAQEKLAAAQARAEKLNTLTLEFEMRASDEGKLFGSLGVREIALAINDKGHEATKSEVLMPEGSIRAVGDYEVDLQLHTDVSATVKVVVKAE